MPLINKINKIFLAFSTFLLACALVLGGCSSDNEEKKKEPAKKQNKTVIDGQVQALKKAKELEKTLQKQADERQKKIDEASKTEKRDD